MKVEEQEVHSARTGTQRGDRLQRHQQRKQNIRCRQVAAKVLETMANEDVKVLTPVDPTGENVSVQVKLHHGVVKLSIDRLPTVSAHVFDQNAEALKGTNSVDNLSRVLRQNPYHVDILSRRLGLLA